MSETIVSPAASPAVDAPAATSSPASGVSASISESVAAPSTISAATSANGTASLSGAFANPPAAFPTAEVVANPRPVSNSSLSAIASYIWDRVLPTDRVRVAPGTNPEDMVTESFIWFLLIACIFVFSFSAFTIVETSPVARVLRAIEFSVLWFVAHMFEFTLLEISLVFACLFVWGFTVYLIIERRATEFAARVRCRIAGFRVLMRLYFRLSTLGLRIIGSGFRTREAHILSMRNMVAENMWFLNSLDLDPATVSDALQAVAPPSAREFIDRTFNSLTPDAFIKHYKPIGRLRGVDWQTNVMRIFVSIVTTVAHGFADKINQASYVKAVEDAVDRVIEGGVKPMLALHVVVSLTFCYLLSFFFPVGFICLIFSTILVLPVYALVCMGRAFKMYLREAASDGFASYTGYWNSIAMAGDLVLDLASIEAGNKSTLTHESASSQAAKVTMAKAHLAFQLAQLLCFCLQLASVFLENATYSRVCQICFGIMATILGTTDRTISAAAKLMIEKDVQVQGNLPISISEAPSSEDEVELETLPSVRVNIPTPPPANDSDEEFDVKFPDVDLPACNAPEVALRMLNLLKFHDRKWCEMNILIPWTHDTHDTKAEDFVSRLLAGSGIYEIVTNYAWVMPAHHLFDLTDLSQAAFYLSAFCHSKAAQDVVKNAIPIKGYDVTVSFDVYEVYVDPHCHTHLRPVRSGVLLWYHNLRDKIASQAESAEAFYRRNSKALTVAWAVGFAISVMLVGGYWFYQQQYRSLQRHRRQAAKRAKTVAATLESKSAKQKKWVNKKMFALIYNGHFDQILNILANADDDPNTKQRWVQAISDYGDWYDGLLDKMEYTRYDPNANAYNNDVVKKYLQEQDFNATEWAAVAHELQQSEEFCDAIERLQNADDARSSLLAQARISELARERYGKKVSRREIEKKFDLEPARRTQPRNAKQAQYWGLQSRLIARYESNPALKAIPVMAFMTFAAYQRYVKNGKKLDPNERDVYYKPSVSKECIPRLIEKPELLLNVERVPFPMINGKLLKRGYLLAFVHPPKHESKQRSDKKVPSLNPLNAVFWKNFNAIMANAKRETPTRVPTLHAIKRKLRKMDTEEITLDKVLPLCKSDWCVELFTNQPRHEGAAANMNVDFLIKELERANIGLYHGDQRVSYATHIRGTRGTYLLCNSHSVRDPATDQLYTDLVAAFFNTAGQLFNVEIVLTPGTIFRGDVALFPLPAKCASYVAVASKHFSAALTDAMFINKTFACVLFHAACGRERTNCTPTTTTVVKGESVPSGSLAMPAVTFRHQASTVLGDCGSLLILADSTFAQRPLIVAIHSVGTAGGMNFAEPLIPEVLGHLN